MTPHERDDVDGELAEYVWFPQPGPQTLAATSGADIIGYGGAAGGGKSDLALGLAANRPWHKRSLILRREATQLRGLVDRLREILCDRGRFNENTGVWRLPGGHQIELGGCKDPGDERKYMGRPHDLLVFDEADQFLRHQVVFLSAWLRTTDPLQKCTLLLTFNPPRSAEGEWIIDFFAPWLRPDHPNPAQPGELRWYAQVGDIEVERPDGTPFVHDGETIKPQSRTFIPAKLTDNRFLLATDYGRTLQALPEPFRSQLLHGDFSKGRQDHERQVIPTEWIKLAMKRWAAMPANSEPLSAIGVDVARGGTDKTVLAPRRKTWYGKLLKYPGSSTPDGDRVVELVENVITHGRPSVNVDVIGVGSSVYDGCRRKKLNVHAIDFRCGTDKKDRAGVMEFANLRAWAYWHMREVLDPVHGENVALPDDRELLVDLAAPRWEMTMRGLKIEGKDEIQKRIGRSPDSGDAVVLASLQTTPMSIGLPEQGRGNVVDAAPPGVFGRR